MWLFVLQLFTRTLAVDLSQDSAAVPPSKPYLMVDMATPWVAGSKYTVTCIAPDAKPMADITLYKDGVELTGAQSFTMSGSKDKLLNTHAEVTVTAVSSDNGRQLACHAQNPALFRPVETTMTMKVHSVQGEAFNLKANSHLLQDNVSVTASSSHGCPWWAEMNMNKEADPPQPPVILGLEREEVKEGRTLVLECVSHGGNPLATLQWTKNEEVLSTTWEEDVVAQKSSSILFLKTRPTDNQAVLCCESVNTVSSSPLSVSRKITVLFEPAEVTLLGSFTAIEGQDINMGCYATSSNPPVQIRWWLGYKELNTSGEAMEEGDNGGMTTMSNMTHMVSREDDGLKLTCEAFNKGTHFSKTQFDILNVYYPPQNVWLDTPPVSPLRSGTTVRLVCFSTGGNPTATLTWFKNGRAVHDALRQTSFERGVARELILVLTPSDNMATFRCDATNKAKKTISAQTKLKVHFLAVSMKISTKQEVQRQGQMLTLECQSGSSNPQPSIRWSLDTVRFGKAIDPPEFSPKQPAQIQVLEDDVAVIPLLLSANPEEVSCIWLHRRETLVKGDPRLCDGSIYQVLVELSQQAGVIRALLHPLSFSEGSLRFHRSDDNSLEIKNVTRKHAGVYTVKCTNEEGVNQASIMLDVLYAPSVKAEKDPVVVNLGETADLICVADANPIISGMFTWKWLGEGEVEMGEENQQDESGLLTIHDVTRAHAGLYQCSANNDIAPPATVEVHLKGAQWTKVASRGDGTTTAEVVCQAEGIPRVDFSWEKKGVRMDFANPRYEERTVREGSFHTSTVRVVNVSTNLDYAVFSCTARNSLGEDTLHIQLVSTNHPDPPSSFGQVDVSHDSVTLEWIPSFNGGLRQRFRVRYRWDQSDSFLYVDVFPPGATTFTVTGLQPVTTYNFSVNALNAMGESAYADNNAVLTITTKERPEGGPTDDDSVSQSASGLPAYLTVVFTVVFGVLLVFNSVGCFFGLRWKRRRGQTGGRGGSVLDGKKNKEEGGSHSTVSTSNKYESREKINTAAQRTLLIDSGSETDSHVYESYAAGSSHYYYPGGDYMPLNPLPEETRRHDVTRLPVDPHSHLYEDVRDRGLYQDILASTLPSPPSLFDHRLPHQRNDRLLKERGMFDNRREILIFPLNNEAN
ncbi:hypothetical protein NQZ68_033197 [Dissostichus eleginoides]|nr:hypothetical protein NQZ68_033197 [Dissostichus eleginoides]